MKFKKKKKKQKKNKKEVIKNLHSLPMFVVVVVMGDKCEKRES